ncbi:MAG: anaerobic ribonucleoside-triphosphate reductase activating protein [Acidiferrobacter sp.]
MKLQLGGMVPWSSVDYPGHMAATLFCNGCPWRCRYCHNSHLWERSAGLSWRRVLTFLERRQGLLEAVVVSGGEPLIQAGAAAAALGAVRDLGLMTGLHTAGVSARRLQSLLPVLDWVGFDIKGPFDRYAAITGQNRSGQAARQSLDLLLASGTACEFRTTVHPQLLSSADLVALVTELGGLGITGLVLQPFRPHGCPDQRLIASYRPWLTKGLHARLLALMPTLRIRGIPAVAGSSAVAHT